jgi:pyrroloquinoline quinone biosynthesis protein B
MRIKILGSAAGGGFPQWNCNCRNCFGLRSHKIKAKPRTQTQLAFTVDDKFWFLINASPDLRSQILNTPELAPPISEPTGSPIAGVFLPSADVDAVAGLLHLREFQPFFVFVTSSLQRILKKENRIFNVLDRAEPPVEWQTLGSQGRLGCHLQENPGEAPAFICATFPLGDTYPDYVSSDLVRTLLPDESSIGFTFEHKNKSVVVAPSVSGHHPEWHKQVVNADVVLIDGTFWSEDELRLTGRSEKTAREIGHLPLSGTNGLLEQFPRNSRARRILIHINNTNPILDEASSEHRVILDAGYEIAYDGMEIEL